MSPDWLAELEIFRKMSADQRIAWCLRVILELTILARATYVAGTGEVADPRRLRRFNELIHRVAGGRVDDMDASAMELFFELIGEASMELRVSAPLLRRIRGSTPV